jgi:hypothetical protein
MIVSVFKSRNTWEKPREKESSFSELYNFFSTAAKKEIVKDEGPLFKLAKFGDLREAEDKSYRSNENVISVSGVVGDIDRNSPGFSEAVSILRKAGIKAIVKTSASYDPENKKIHVICPFSRGLPPEAHRREVAKLNRVFAGVLASESFVLSQAFYFFPGIGKSQNAQVEAVEGECIDKLEIEPLYGAGEGEEKHQKNGKLPIEDDVVRACREKGLEPEWKGNGVWAMYCPWSRDKSFDVKGEKHKSRDDKGAKYLVPGYGGYLLPAFHCHHGTCVEANRGLSDLLLFLGLKSENPFDDVKARGERNFFDKNARESTALRLVGFDEMLSDDEPPRWIIHNFINEGAFVQIFGEPEAGKSFVAIDWGLCIASGRDWAGHRIFSPGPVIYIAGEGTKDFNKRIKAWVKENGGASGKDLPFYRFNHATALLDEEKLIEAGKLIEAVTTKHGKVSAVVIDTLNRNFGGGDENSTKDMTAAVSAIDKIIRKFGCAVIVVHHTGHGDKTRSRGSGVLHAANDFDYKVERRGQYATVSCTKAKDFERPMEVSFRMEKVPVGRDADTGEDIDSLVFRKVDGVEVELAEMEEAHAEKSVSDTAIRILVSLLHDSDAVSEDEWRDKLFAEWSREEPDAKKGALLKRFQRVKKDSRLIAQGEKGALFFKVKTK